jgi:hypothetical protein
MVTPLHGALTSLAELLSILEDLASGLMLEAGTLRTTLLTLIAALFPPSTPER